jgi:hypothetical protein
MTKEQVALKLEAILERIKPEQTQILADELAKIVPASAEAEVAWQVSSVYDFDEDIVHGSFSIKVNPAQVSNEKIALSLHLKKLLKNLKINILEDIDETLNQLIDYTIGNMEMRLSPAMYLKDEIGVIHFGVSGKIKDTATLGVLKERADEKMKGYVL